MANGDVIIVDTINDLLNDNYHLDNRRTAALRQCHDALALLEVMPHALANGRTAVVQEYIERVTAHIQRATGSLTL